MHEIEWSADGDPAGESTDGALRLDFARRLMSLTSLRDKLIKIGAKVISHGRYVTFQLAEVSIAFEDVRFW